MLGDRAPGVEDLRQLRFCTRVINEAMRLYPQPPVLIRWGAGVGACVRACACVHMCRGMNARV